MNEPTKSVDLGGKNHAEVHRYTDDVCEIVYCPGNATRYHLVVARIPSMPEKVLAAFPAMRDGGSSYWLGNAYMHASYVYQKWPSYAQADIPHMTRMLRCAKVEMGLVQYPGDVIGGATEMDMYLKETFQPGWEGIL